MLKRGGPPLRHPTWKWVPIFSRACLGKSRRPSTCLTLVLYFRLGSVLKHISATSERLTISPHTLATLFLKFLMLFLSDGRSVLKEFLSLILDVVVASNFPENVECWYEYGNSQDSYHHRYSLWACLSIQRLNEKDKSWIGLRH